MKIWEKGMSMLIDFHTHLDFYRQSELNMQLEVKLLPDIIFVIRFLMKLNKKRFGKN